MSATGRTRMPRRGTPEWKLWEEFLRRQGGDVEATTPTKRRKDDDYPTPEWATQALLRNVQLPRDGWWVEPCAGEGAIIRAAAKLNIGPAKGWIAIEKNARRAKKLEAFSLNPLSPFVSPWHDDFRNWSGAGCGGLNPLTPPDPVAVITNPPFTLAQEVAEWALALPSKPVVALLLRDGFASSAKRKDFWETHPGDRFTLSSRPSFVDGRTDACDYTWFVWWNGRASSLVAIGRWGRLERGAT